MLAPTVEDMGHTVAHDDRRGQAPPYVSYWTQRTRARRAAIFRLAEAGWTPADIADELGIDEAEVAAVLRSDRRRRAE